MYLAKIIIQCLILSTKTLFTCIVATAALCKNYKKNTYIHVFGYRIDSIDHNVSTGFSVILLQYHTKRVKTNY